MNKCWKCQAETKHGAAECDDCAAGVTSAVEVDEADIDLLEVDWDKVKTVEDLKEIIREQGFLDYFVAGTATAKRLQRFLRPLDDSEIDGRNGKEPHS